MSDDSASQRNFKKIYSVKRVCVENMRSRLTEACVGGVLGEGGRGGWGGGTYSG